MKLKPIALCAVFLTTLTPSVLFAQQREVERPTGGVVDFLAPIDPDPIIQHSREVYVKNGCAYCHGVDLKVRNGEAADLMSSTIVGSDVKANIIGPLLKNGIPQTAKLSPMPQFKDLSDKNIEDLARWIHHSRQLGRFNDLKVAAGGAGDSAAGKAAFETSCSGCHSTASMTQMATKYSPADLRRKMLRPASLNKVQSFTVQALHDTAMKDAKQKHGTFLENATQTSVNNLSAYLASLK